MGLVDPDPDPKSSLNIGQQQRNFLLEELYGGLYASPPA